MHVTIGTAAPAALHGLGRAVALTVALAAALCLLTGLARLAWRVWRSWRAPSILGAEALVGRRATVRRATGRAGQVLLDGVLWRARSSGGPLRAHQTVEVLGVEGLELVVAPEERHGREDWEEWDPGAGGGVTALHARWG